MKHLALALIFLASPALAQQATPDEQIKALGQMLTQSQQENFQLRLAVIHLQGEAEKAKAVPPPAQAPAEKP